ncbi:MAG: hypothetical protein DRJ11_06135 [Candidatus Aminicenantes bacterium]|nr:MAG: hypothetical protein DRJ11_06135 [Candidatus Aminicenantes bacterium]HHF42966.1 hypothetical protein [Candidatus Aminicenantes bacterium]
MALSKLDKAVNNALKILKEVLPDQTYLYLPLLSRALVWGLRRYFHRQAELMATPVWPWPARIKVKPDEFILDFFQTHSGLRREFATELKNKDLKSLREAFVYLYPLLGLNEPFLWGLFAPELGRQEYRLIIRTFQDRLDRARRDLASVSSRKKLISALKTFQEDITAMAIDLSGEAEVRRSLVKLLQQSLPPPEKD